MASNYHKDGFVFFKPILSSGTSSNEDRLIVESSRISETVEYIKKNRITSIHISSQYYKSQSLDFIRELKFIKCLFVLIESIDLNAINELTDLEELRMDSSNTIVDFSNFTRLKVLSFSYHKNLINFSQCFNLRSLWINRFKKDDLELFKGLVNLEYLFLHKSSILNLCGIEKLSKLKEIHLDSVPKLQSLEGISENHIWLEILDIYNAPVLQDYKNLCYLKNLLQLELRKTGDITSVEILLTLPRLEKVTLGLKVLDGMVKQLNTIPQVGFVDYPHYDSKLKNLK